MNITSDGMIALVDGSTMTASTSKQSEATSTQTAGKDLRHAVTATTARLSSAARPEGGEGITDSEQLQCQGRTSKSLIISTDLSKTRTTSSKRPLACSEDRLQRSRERNRIHARKTRQRKKELMQNLRSQSDSLKDEQVRLKQRINEKSIASILIGLYQSSTGDATVEEDPRVEALLRRPVDEIPDSSKITELPALILPGHHPSKKAKLLSGGDDRNSEVPDDGIDYELLGRDRTTCSAEELDKIRRERNRMHAKRTRDRKRVFMEEMAEMCRQLEEENEVLRCHLLKIAPNNDGETPTMTVDAGKRQLQEPKSNPAVSPTATSSSAVSATPSIPSVSPDCGCQASGEVQSAERSSGSKRTFDQLQTLLAAATESFDCDETNGDRSWPESSQKQQRQKTAVFVSDDSSSAGSLDAKLCDPEVSEVRWSRCFQFHCHTGN